MEGGLSTYSLFSKHLHLKFSSRQEIDLLASASRVLR